MQLLAKFKKILLVWFRATLNHLSVHLNANEQVWLSNARYDENGNE